jgi:hypothetical protein
VKPLESNYDLTEKAGRQLRYFGWFTADGWYVARSVSPCQDCGRGTTWRDRDGHPRHPWACERG